jgi:hypothetical protein
MSVEASASEKKLLLFITSRSYNVAFLKRYRFLHLIFGFLPYTSAFVIFELTRQS